MSVKLRWSFTACSLETREERSSTFGLLTRTPFALSPTLHGPLTVQAVWGTVSSQCLEIREH
ncbi:hypothetical protein A7J08_08990 [Streptococcus suis]|uniref:Uncharacterized protein n=1 Tax=Streptococcus suis TaxID=1307 RepID=A0A4T2GW47_STRSU|nr:hypothetical protein E8L09_05915 [Streptococcus suis]